MKFILFSVVFLAALFFMVGPASATEWADNTYAKRTCWNLTNPATVNKTNLTYEFSLNLSEFAYSVSAGKDFRWGNASAFSSWVNVTAMNLTGGNTTMALSIQMIKTDNTSLACLYYGKTAETIQRDDIFGVGHLSTDFTSKAGWGDCGIMQGSGDAYGSGTNVTNGELISTGVNKGVYREMNGAENLSEYVVMIRGWLDGAAASSGLGYQIGFGQNSGYDYYYMRKPTKYVDVYNVSGVGMVGILQDSAYTFSLKTYHYTRAVRLANGTWIQKDDGVSVPFTLNTANRDRQFFNNFSLFLITQNDKVDLVIVGKWCDACGSNRNVEETTSTGIFITSPTNTTYSNTSTIALAWINLSFFSVSAKYELDGVNTSITGDIFNTSITGVTDGPHTIRIYATNSSGIILSSLPAYFSVVHPVYLIITKPINNSIVSPPYVELNHTYNSFSPCNYTYYFIDGGPHVPTSCANTTAIMTAGNHSITLWANNSAGRTAQTTINISYASPIVDCGTPGAFVSANFTFWDEENPLNVTTGSAEYAVTIFLGTYNFTYNLSVVNDSDFSICTNAGPWAATMIMKYSGETQSTRFYFFDHATLSSVTNHIKLYLLNDSKDTIVSVTVQDSYGYPVENAIISFQRYYISEDLYRTVAMGRTDNEGTATVSLFTENTWFKYIMTQNGLVRNIIGPAQITSSSILLPLESNAITTWNDYSGQISRVCAYTAATGYLSCTFTQVTGLFTNVCIDVDIVGVLNNTRFNLTCLSTSSGTVMMNISTAKSYNSSIVYRLYGTSPEGQTIILEDGSVLLGHGAFYGGIGIFLTIIIFCVCAGMGAWNPAVALALSFLGTMFSAMAGFVDIPVLALGNLLVVIVIFIIHVKT